MILCDRAKSGLGYQTESERKSSQWSIYGVPLQGPSKSNNCSSKVSLGSSDPWLLIIWPMICSSWPGTFKQGAYHNISFRKVPKNNISMQTSVSERTHAKERERKMMIIINNKFKEPLTLPAVLNCISR